AEVYGDGSGPVASASVCVGGFWNLRDDSQSESGAGRAGVVWSAAGRECSTGDFERGQLFIRRSSAVRRPAGGRPDLSGARTGAAGVAWRAREPGPGAGFRTGGRDSPQPQFLARIRCAV